MKVGCLGDIPFYVSANTIQTVSNFTWSGSANYSVHKRPMGNALTEYTGCDPDEISFEIELSVFLGVNPWDALLKIWDYERNAVTLPLILGNKAYGKYRWCIKSHKITVRQTDGNGNLASVKVAVSLIEYLKKGG